MHTHILAPNIAIQIPYAQAVNNKKFRSGILFWSCTLLAGIGARYGLSFIEPNFDVDSYKLVVKRVMETGLVYTGGRYNYGPLWAYILIALQKISDLMLLQPLSFQHMLTLFLTFVDYFIAYLLFKKGKQTAAVCFFLSPIAIYISGYHRQFDNLAILIALSAAFWLESKKESSEKNELHPHILTFAMMLGLSLIIKHIFAFFLFWILIRPGNWKYKSIMCILPILLFLASFTPFWNRESQSIINQVFRYNSSGDAVFYNTYVAWWTGSVISAKGVFVIGISAAGFLFRKFNIFDSMLFYTALLVILSSSMADQYFSIPTVFSAAYLNVFSIAYNLLMGIFFIFARLLPESSQYPIIKHLVWYGYPTGITCLMISVVKAYLNHPDRIKFIR